MPDRVFNVGLVLGGISLTLFLMMTWLDLHIPHAHDLYNTVYGSVERHQSENTEVFLFGFPAACLVGSVLLPISISRKLAAGLEINPLTLLVLGVWFSAFALGAIHRFWVVKAFYAV